MHLDYSTCIMGDVIAYAMHTSFDALVQELREREAQNEKMAGDASVHPAVRRASIGMSDDYAYAISMIEHYARDPITAARGLSNTAGPLACSFNAASRVLDISVADRRAILDRTPL